jgi:AcrR family transcriptional regulator
MSMVCFPYLYGVKIALAMIPVLVKQNLYSVNMTAYTRIMTRKTDSRRTAASAPRKAAKAMSKAMSKATNKARTMPRAAAKQARAATSSYHHGDLHDALLKAAERILERDGLPGLTLRAVAREAGVSHAAPAHHFGDLVGLLSELAAIGYGRFGTAIQAAASAGRSPAEVGLARGRAYIDFARAHPAMYQLMFSAERLDMNNPVLRQAADASFSGLVAAVNANRNEAIAEDGLTLDQGADIARIWSLVHGFAMLLIDGRLQGILKYLPAGTDASMLLDAMLKSTAVRPG